MSNEPQYGWVPCGMPKCKGKAPMYHDPNNFNFARLCRDHRAKKQTHTLEPFCNHGKKLSSWLDDPPLPCGCTVEKDIDEATWDWVERPKGLEREGQPPSPTSDQQPL